MRTMFAATVVLAGVLTASWATAQTTQTAPNAPARPPAATTTAPAPSTSQGALIDIDSASSDQLQTLSGIGPARAEAIVKGRPYRGKDELHRKSIIPESVYEGIKDKIVARQN